MKKQILTGLLVATFSTSAFASEVTGYTPATSGEAATAAAVNDNFTALIGAINDNAQRIAALEDQSTAGSVAGTYEIIEFTVELGGNTGTTIATSYSEITTISSTGTFTLDEFGNFSASVSEIFSSLKDDRNCDDPGTDQEQCRFAYNPDFSSPGSVTYSGTWADDNNAVTLTFPDNSTAAFLKAGPRLLLRQNREVLNEGNGLLFDSNNLFFLIKRN